MRRSFLKPGDVIELAQDKLCYVGAVNDCRALARRIKIEFQNVILNNEVDLEDRMMTGKWFSISPHSECEIWQTIKPIKIFQIQTENQTENKP